MRAYRQVHVYPMEPFGWLTLEVVCVGEMGRVNKGEPFELRPWVREEQRAQEIFDAEIAPRLRQDALLEWWRKAGLL